MMKSLKIIFIHIKDISWNTSKYYTYSKNGFKYTNDNFDNINSQVLKKFEFINKDIENKGVYLTTSDLEFSRNSWESFASYYYDTKIGNITLEEKGKAIG